MGLMMPTTDYLDYYLKDKDDLKKELSKSKF